MAWVIADQKGLPTYKVGEEKAPIPIVPLLLAGLGVVTVLAIAVRRKK